MSHGPSTEGDVKAEPNLVPLLDMVMQLLMFFIVSINFVTQEINENIELPVAQSAGPMDKGNTDVLFLNLNQKGFLEVVGESQPRQSLVEMNLFLKDKYADAKRLAQERGDKKVNTTVIIRADQRVPYKLIYQILHQCKEVGYSKLQLRAMTK